MKTTLSLILILISVTSCTKDDDCVGEELQGVGCGLVYDPVCGCNGKTYSNSCVARVAGVKSWKDGECD